LGAGKYGIDFVGNLSSGFNFPFDTHHEGHPGFCDDGCSGSNVADNVISWLDNNPADVILLHIGTNGFNTSNAGVDTILNNINTWATANYPTTVFVARIIPTVDGSLNVNTFNNQVELIDGDRSNVKTFNVNQQTEAGLNASDPSGNFANPILMTDNLHPTQTGYNLMADKWNVDLVASGVLPSCPP
jgi:lysophospholipase L1-like esterase